MAITMTFGGYQPPASIHNQAARRFGERLEQRLGGRIAFELIGSVLDHGRASADLPVMVEKGELSFCYMSTVRFSGWVPELLLLELPFLVRDRRTVWAALDGALGERLTRRLHATTPFRALGLWDNGFRHLTNRVRPIQRPADCRGLRIRTQASALHGEVFRALGFVPHAIDIKEFVQQVAGDAIDAHDNPLTSIYVFGVHRHHRYITLTGHFFGASLMICDERRYRSWPPEVRAAVDEAAAAATALQRRLAVSEDQDVLARLDPRENEVIRPTADDHAAFVEAVQPVLAKYRAQLDPELFSALEAV
ncbi:MAG: TRAP transporter substrate-binding protein [Candidatus Rokuibacteriota bacterium]